MNATYPACEAGFDPSVLLGDESAIVTDTDQGLEFSPRDPANKTVRAALIRRLLVGDPPGSHLSTKPLRISDLRVTGELYLSDQQVIRSFFANNCDFEGPIRCCRSDLRYVELRNCTVGKEGQTGEQIVIDHARLPQGISLMGSTIHGEVMISFTSVGGNARFSGTIIHNGFQSPNPEGVFNWGSYALNCEGSNFSADLIFDHGFEAHGEVWLIGMTVAGDIYFRGSFTNPSPDAQAPAGSRNAISLARSRIDGCFDFRGIGSVAGVVRLGSLKACVLLDDDQSWAKVEILSLNGFCFESIGGTSPKTWKMRSAWLKKQAPFARQPWMQTIAVLRGAGHVHDADRLGIEFEKELGRKKFGKRYALRFWHAVYGLLTAYGYRPQRALYELIVLWGASALFFEIASKYGVFAPADPHIFLDSAFDSCRAASQWVACPVLADEYPRFSGTMYALDLILPVIDLHLEREWMPMATTTLGWFARALAWLDIMLGWVGSVAMVAALTKLLNRG
jgi:hypothetical protein